MATAAPGRKAKKTQVSAKNSEAATPVFSVRLPGELCQLIETVHQERGVPKMDLVAQALRRELEGDTLTKGLSGDEIEQLRIAADLLKRAPRKVRAILRAILSHWAEESQRVGKTGS